MTHGDPLVTATTATEQQRSHAGIDAIAGLVAAGRPDRSGKVRLDPAALGEALGELESAVAAEADPAAVALVARVVDAARSGSRRFSRDVRVSSDRLLFTLDELRFALWAGGA